MVVPIRLDEETKPSAPVKQPQPLERRGSATFKSNKRLTEAWARAAAPKVERRAGGGAGLGSSKSVPALGAANKPRTTLSGGASAVAARQSLAQLLDGMSGEAGAEGGGVVAAPTPAAAAAAARAASGEPPTLQEALYAGLGRVVEMFRRLDLTSSGEVDKVDFRRTLGAVLSGDFGRDEVDELFERFDTERLGKIDYAEFNRLIRKEQHATLKAAKAASTAAAGLDEKKVARPWRRAAEAFALSEETPPIERGRPPPLHMGRKRELVRLLRDFAQQHEDGVCRVKSFRHLLRLEYPKACKEDLKAMLDFVGTMTDFEAAATEAAKARKEEVEQIFRAIDFDASGSIDEKEFVENLLQSAQDHGMGRDALVKLFRAKDVDGSGTLDMSEFVELVNESDLFNHRAAIIQQGEQVKDIRLQMARERADVWKIGLPSRSGESTRPTLANVSADALNQQQQDADRYRLLVRRNSMSRPSLAAMKPQHRPMAVSP